MTSHRHQYDVILSPFARWEKSYVSGLSWVVGWCDGAGQTSSAGASYNLDYSRARAYCTCSWCRWGLFGHFYSHLSFLSSFSLSLGDGPTETEILSQRAVKPKTTNQPTNQPTNSGLSRSIICTCSVIISIYIVKQVNTQLTSKLLLSFSV